VVGYRAVSSSKLKQVVSENGGDKISEEEEGKKYEKR
jgi:hypothetical protein